MPSPSIVQVPGSGITCTPTVSESVPGTSDVPCTWLAKNTVIPLLVEEVSASAPSESGWSAESRNVATSSTPLPLLPPPLPEFTPKSKALPAPPFTGGEAR